jgi:hypothetical protein
MVLFFVTPLSIVAVKNQQSRKNAFAESTGHADIKGGTQAGGVWEQGAQKGQGRIK